MARGVNHRVLHDVPVLIVGLLLAFGLTACSYSNVELFAVRADENGRLELLACADGLPAEVEVWALGESRVVGDDDDQLIWGPSSVWEEVPDLGLSKMTTDVEWVPHLGLGIWEHDASIGFGAGDRPPAPGTLDLLDGGEQVTVDEFRDDQCPDS